MRNHKEIRKWMLDEDLNVKKIAEDHAVNKHRTAVSHTLSGRRNDYTILRFLIDKGCPIRFLDLPPRLKEAA